MNDAKIDIGQKSSRSMNSSFTEHFRCPDSVVTIRTSRSPLGENGYFRFGEDVVCFGATSSGITALRPEDEIPDEFPSAKLGLCEVDIPFDLDQVATNLR